MPLLPYVRRELFLQAIKNRDASALPDPNNREELFLKAIAEETALIPSGVSVVLPAEVSEMLANLPEAHTHTERFYRDIIDAILVATTVTDTTPYLIRDTANHAPITPPARLTKKLGNTVAVNQFVDTSTTSVTIPSGHKYYAVINGTASIGTSNGTAIAVTGGQDIVIDLTLWFGSNDRIPSDLLSHPENWGRYYAGSLDYNAGTLESADGSILTSLPRNCFDGELESGSYNPTTGAKVVNANCIRSKNLIPCIPGETYYFKAETALPAQVFYVVFFDSEGNYVGNNVNGYYDATKVVPANAHFMAFWAGSSSWNVTDTSRKFCISIYYSGESGYDESYPYSVLAEVDTGSEVLRSAGAVADEKTPDGKITWRVGYVDIGTLSWSSYSADSSGHSFVCSTPSYIKSAPNNDYVPKFLSAKFVPVAFYSAASFVSNDKAITQVTNAQRIIVRDTAYSNATTFQSAMSGVMLYYELATPTTEQGTAFDPVYGVEYGGTESWTNQKGIPQGHETEYTEYTT